LAKTDTESRRRLALARLRDSEVVTKLFGDLGPRFKARPGGYTRILHMLPRPGDAAPMALMQLVEGPASAAQAAAATAEAAAGKRARKKAPKKSADAAGESSSRPRRRKAAAA